MFSVSTIKSTLLGSIGLRDSDDPALPVNTLTGTTQSVYYDDYHPLVTFDNLYALAPNYDGMNFDQWSNSTGYATGVTRIYNNIAYKSQRTVATSDVPSLTSTAWQSPVKDWILTKENAAINKLVNTIFTDKKLNEATKTFLDSVQVVDGAGRITDTVTASGRFVGFEITLKRMNNIKAVINYIGLQFTQKQTNLDVYLFHSSQKSAVAKWTLTSASAHSFDWLDASSPGTGDNELHYVNYTDNIDSGGIYYLGYFEDDISGAAIEKKEECTDCPGYPNSSFKWSKWCEIRPIEVTSGHLDGYNIFDVDDVGYTETNCGLNFSFSIKSDITELMVNNKELFTNALGYQFANDVLEMIIFNADARINRRQDNASRNAAVFDVNAPEEYDNIRRKLRDAIGALSFDLSRISQVLPEGGRRKLKFRTI